MSNHEDFFAHFPPKVSQGIVNYVTETVLLRSRYIFVRRVGGIQFGYCTHCKKDYMTLITLKHNQDWQCVKCKSLCKVKSSGMGRSYMQDEGYLIYYEKSVINPQAIVARGIHVVRNYSGDYYQVETLFDTVAMYLFEPGKGRMFRQSWRGKWEEGKNILSETVNSMRNKRCYTAIESIVPAVHGTPFQYSTWEKYADRYIDLVHFFGLAAKYPCVEYLTKIGLQNIVEDKLDGDRTFGVINWRGKTLDKVLRLTKVEIKELREVVSIMSPHSLHSYQYYKKQGIKLTFSQANLLREIIYGIYNAEVKELLSRVSLERLSKYILKQLEREGAEKHYRHASSVVLALRDYINDCNDLGMDLTQEHVLLPNNLHAAHQKTIEKVKIKEDKALNVLIAKRLKDLIKYEFEFAGFILRPAKDSKELFQEGKALNHCVGSYSERYAKGKTNIFLIRKTDEPDIPFYTMEVINDKITQTYGKSNRQPSDEVNEFIKVFTAKKLAKKTRKSKDKVQIAQPA